MFATNTLTLKIKKMNKNTKDEEFTNCQDCPKHKNESFSDDSWSDDGWHVKCEKHNRYVAWDAQSVNVREASKRPTWCN